jgi:hypothetical protein
MRKPIAVTPSPFPAPYIGNTIPIPLSRDVNAPQHAASFFEVAILDTARWFT